MNGPHTPAFSRNNSFTRLVERVAAENLAAGKPAGRSVDQMGRTTPVVPFSRRGSVPDFVPDPLDPTQEMRANASAAALGITDVMGTPLSGRPEEDGISDAEIDRMLRRGGDVPVSAPAPPPPTRPTDPPTRSAPMRVAEPTTAQPARPVPVMPDFTRVEGYDLIKGVVVIDGVEFPLTRADMVAMKKFAFQIVLDSMTYNLAQALTALGISPEAAAEAVHKEVSSAQEEKGGGKTQVQHVQDSQATGGVRAGAGEEVRSAAPLSVVRASEVQEATPDGAGSSEATPEPELPEGPTDDVRYLLGDGEATPS